MSGSRGGCGSRCERTPRGAYTQTKPSAKRRGRHTEANQALKKKLAMEELACACVRAHHSRAWCVSDIDARGSSSSSSHSSPSLRRAGVVVITTTTVVVVVVVVVDVHARDPSLTCNTERTHLWLWLDETAVARDDWFRRGVVTSAASLIRLRRWWAHRRARRSNCGASFGKQRTGRRLVVLRLRTVPSA